MKQGKAATTTLGSADYLPLAAEMYTMFGKCLHVISMTGRQPITDARGWSGAPFKLKDIL